MEYIPPGYIGVLQKIDEIGRAQHGAAWRGDKIPELRATFPPEVSRTPAPIEPLSGTGISMATGGGLAPELQSHVTPGQLARYAQQRQAVQQQIAESSSQRDEAIGELKRRIWLREEVAYEHLPDGSLSVLPKHWGYSEAADRVFLIGVTESGHPVLIAEKVASENIGNMSRSDEIRPDRAAAQGPGVSIGDDGPLAALDGKEAANTIDAQPAPDQSEEPPLRGKALTTALDEWVQHEWGPDFSRLPGRDDLLVAARFKFRGSRINRDHVAVLRKKYATSEAKRGGAPTHTR
jgi:hypothetical protein